MKLFLSLCIISSAVALNFDMEKCIPEFFKIQDILELEANELEEICLDQNKITKKTDILKNILKECGLKDWSSSTNDAKDRRIGSVVNGLFDYMGELLCMKKKNTWCYPGAVKIFDLNYMMKLIPAMQSDNFNLDALNLKCSVMGNEEAINAICPGGPRYSGRRLCQDAMIAEFEIAVRTIQQMIKEYTSNDITEELMPLLNLALDVKKICKKGPRKLAKRLVKRECAGVVSPTEDVDDALNCLEEDKISDQCLQGEICKIDDDAPECNKINGDTRTLLATHESYTGFLKPRVQLGDGSYLDRVRAKGICCDEDCQRAKAAGNRCGRRKRHQAMWEIIRNGEDLWRLLQNQTDLKDQYIKAICLDQLSKGSDFAQCTCTFHRGRPGNQISPLFRRLLDNNDDNTQTVIVEVNVDSTETTPFNCESDGTLFGFDNVLNEAGNAHSTNDVTLEVGMNVTNGECQGMGGGTGSSTSGAMQFSISFVAMFFCVFFADRKSVV